MGEDGAPEKDHDVVVEIPEAIADDPAPTFLVTSPPLAPLPTEHPPEDFRAWLQVAGSFSVFFNIWGLPLAYGTFQAFYKSSYLASYPESSIAWIGTSQNFLLILIGVFTGPLFDKGHFRSMLFLGATLNTLGIMMLSLAHTYPAILLSQGICTGIGAGLLYIPSLTLVTGTFRSRRRPLAVGIATSGIGVGAVVFVTVFRRLLPRIGFPWTVRAIGFIILALYLFAIPALLAGPTKGPGKPREFVDRSAFTDWPFVLYTVLGFSIFLGYAVPLIYSPSYGLLVVPGLSEDLAYYTLAAGTAGSVLGRLAVSLGSMRCGVMVLWLICATMSGILCFVWMTVKTEKGFITFNVFYGFFSGGLIALPPSILPLLCPDPSKLGTRMGMLWVPSAFATLCGSPIAGALVNVQERKFTGLQAFAGSVLLAGSAQVAVLWWLVAKRVSKIWV